MRTSLLIALILGSFANAQQSPVVATVTVTGGKHDLKNKIITIPTEKFETKFGWLLGVAKVGENTPLPSQLLTGKGVGLKDDKPLLVVLIPDLKAESTLNLEVRAYPPPAGPLPPPQLQWLPGENKTYNLFDFMNPRARKLLASYQFHLFDPKATPKDKVLTNPTIKPYHHVYDAEGKRLTNGPDGKFPHHRGIFFGFNQISYDGKKADVWHCRNGEHQGEIGQHALVNGNMFGLHRINVGWYGVDGSKFIDEERVLAFFPLKDGMLVEFRSKLTTDLKDGVKLAGDPQHAGFHFRTNAAVEDVAKETYFLRPDGKGKEGEERNWEPKTKKGPVNLPWNAMCFNLEGKRRTVVYLDQPDNPKEARQSERTYGRIGTYFEYQLMPDKPLFVRYRLWIQDGELTVGDCEALSRSFVEPVKVEVK